MDERKVYTPGSISILLEEGGPWEVLPEEQDHLRGEASRYLADTQHAEEARRRVREVWLEGKYRPAWQPPTMGASELRERMKAAVPWIGESNRLD